MKKSHGFCSVFLGLQLLLPVCVGLGLLADRPFQLVSQPVCFLLLAAASVLLAGKIYNSDNTRLAVPALFFAVINGFVLLLTCDWWGGGLAAVTVMVCGWVVFSRAPGGIAKILCLVLCVLLTLALLLLMPLWLFAAAMGKTTVVQQLDSPGGAYTAQLLDVDAGATGGDTLVKIRDNEKTVNIGIGSFRKEYTLYQGEWGEFQDMELLWEDGDTLLINGRAYEADALLH